MSSPPGRHSRPLSGSRSFQASQSLFPGASSSSRPFLNMLNPMGRAYQGYGQANQSLVEEDEDAGASGSEADDVEAGRSRSTIFQRTSDALRAKAPGKRRVAWDADASEMAALHPNIRQEDKIHEESSDDEVPQSFMIEGAARKGPPRDARPQPLHSLSGRSLPPVLPTTAQQGLPPTVSIPPRPSELDVDAEEPTPRAASTSTGSSGPSRQSKPMRGLDAYERALWNWVNVYNLDAFLQEVYYYYEGKGIYSIALSRGLNLLTVGFVIGFSTFLVGCIDYSRIKPEKVTRLSDVVVGHCVAKFSGFTLLFFLLFTAFYIWQIVSFVLGVRRLVDMYNFYTHLLRIPDADIQTISWPEVVRRIGAIREENPLTALSSSSGRHADSTTTAKLDAHDIANRIMRQENYLIALFNKELLDLRVPLPRALRRFFPEEKGKGKMLTRALEWNLRFCLMEFLFDRHGRVRKVFLKTKNRAALIEGLRRRFIFMGILNAIFAPFIVPYLIMYSFFRYFEEYHKDPSSISGRRYTPYAQWKFREFNELPHVFIRRLDESHPLASMYIAQFPNEKMTLLMRFVAFVAGSFAAVLALVAILDPDLIVHFEVTPHRTVLFYLGVFGSVLAVARGMIPDENRVFDPELLMTEVISYTHYMPDAWRGALHSKRVHTEFGGLFDMKVAVLAQELVSVALTPFVLWFALPPCAPALVDFFREFTVHVDGRGYVCSFAEFDFARHGNVKFGAPARPADARMASNEGKMEKSMLNFKAANPDWAPADAAGSLYLSRMADLARRRPEGTYDRALRQSQHAARRRAGVAGVGAGAGAGLGTASAGVGASGVGGGGGVGASSVFGGPSMARTAVLGDSQGSVMTAGGAGPAAAAASGVSEVGASEELAPDGLGGAYVDGRRRAGGGGGAGGEDEEEAEDGGVLGLLAQIYGARGGPGAGGVI